MGLKKIKSFSFKIVPLIYFMNQGEKILYSGKKMDKRMYEVCKSFENYNRKLGNWIRILRSWIINNWKKSNNKILIFKVILFNILNLMVRNVTLFLIFTKNYLSWNCMLLLPLCNKMHKNRGEELSLNKTWMLTEFGFLFWHSSNILG